jgi:GDP-L-fucose synthase
MKRKSTIIVTGANGLAGSAVVEHLRNEMFTNVVEFTRDGVDLMDAGRVYALFDQIRPEFVFHAAATVYGLGGNMANQGKSIFTNTVINTNVIDASRLVGVKKITVMGTNAIYPWPPKLPYSEGDIFDGRPHSGEAGYGHAKRHMLAMLEAYRESYGLEYSYIVSGNLYGPRDKFDPITGHVLPSLIAKFYDAAVSGGKVSVWGNGSATRDFLYVKDLARVVKLLMSEDITSSAINIGSGHSVSIKTIVEMLCVISGVSADRVCFDPLKPNGRPECHSDLSRIRDLGFTPNYDLATGLRETWDWFVDDRMNSQLKLAI